MSAQLHQELATRDMQMAQFYDGTKNYGSAKTYYAEVINKYPDSELAKQARERMAELAGQAGFPGEAAGVVCRPVPGKPGARGAGQDARDQERHAARPQPPADDRRPD